MFDQQPAKRFMSGGDDRSLRIGEVQPEVTHVTCALHLNVR